MVKMLLNKLLDEKGINQKELGDATKIRQATINSYFNNTNKHIVVEHINLICNFLECNVEDLIFFEFDKEEKKQDYLKELDNLNKQKLIIEEKLKNLELHKKNRSKY